MSYTSISVQMGDICMCYNNGSLTSTSICCGRRPKSAKANSSMAFYLNLRPCLESGLRQVHLLPPLPELPAKQSLAFHAALRSGPIRSASVYYEMPRVILLIVSASQQFKRKFKCYFWLLQPLTLTAFSWKFPCCSVKL